MTLKVQLLFYLIITRNIEVPFPSARLAEVAYHVLRVDGEPKRSGVTKQLALKDNVLEA